MRVEKISLVMGISESLEFSLALLEKGNIVWSGHIPHFGLVGTGPHLAGEVWDLPVGGIEADILEWDALDVNSPLHKFIVDGKTINIPVTEEPQTHSLVWQSFSARLGPIPIPMGLVIGGVAALSLAVLGIALVRKK